MTSGLSVAFGITQLTVAAFALTYDLSHWQCPILKCTSSQMDDCLCYTWVRNLRFLTMFLCLQIIVLLVINAENNEEEEDKSLKVISQRYKVGYQSFHFVIASTCGSLIYTVQCQTSIGSS